MSVLVTSTMVPPQSGECSLSSPQHVQVDSNSRSTTANASSRPNSRPTSAEGPNGQSLGQFNRLNQTETAETTPCSPRQGASGPDVEIKIENIPNNIYSANDDDNDNDNSINNNFGLRNGYLVRNGAKLYDQPLNDDQESYFWTKFRNEPEQALEKLQLQPNIYPNVEVAMRRIIPNRTATKPSVAAMLYILVVTGGPMSTDTARKVLPSYAGRTFEGQTIRKAFSVGETFIPTTDGKAWTLAGKFTEAREKKQGGAIWNKDGGTLKKRTQRTANIASAEAGSSSTRPAKRARLNNNNNNDDDDEEIKYVAPLMATALVVPSQIARPQMKSEIQPTYNQHN